MSATRRATYDFDLDAHEYMHGVYLEDEFAQALYLEGLGFQSYEVLDIRRTEDGGVHRRIRVCPRTNAPAPVRKALGNTQEYTERGALDPGGTVWRYTVVPAALASKIQINGSQRVESLGEGRCRAHFEGTFEVKIFALGGAVERFMAGQFDANLEKQAQFTRGWIQRRA